MPVQLQQITELDQADAADLKKVYADQNFGDDIEQWAKQRLKEDFLLFAGRFNGAILGAVWIIPTDNQWQIKALCVRDITRRRGVARQMMTLLIKEAEKRSLTLRCDHTFLPLAALLAELGFSNPKQDPRTWIK